MSVTLAQARDEMLTLIKTAWDATGYPMLYDDVNSQPPKDRTPWARTTIAHNRGDQETLTNAIGNRLFRRDGILVVQIFAPSGDGLQLADELAKVAMDAYEGKATPGGVWFRHVRYREVGPDGNWYQVNVIVEFEYAEAK